MRRLMAVISILVTAFILIFLSMRMDEARALSYGEFVVPPEGAREMFTELEKCLNKKSEIAFDMLTWKVGDGHVPPVLVGMNGGPYIGVYDSMTDIIYLMRGRHLDPDLIRHELTHVILSPLGGHPGWAFNFKCNNVI